MAIVVSDTSPLRALDHLGHLDWLERLFDQVYLPPAVALAEELPATAILIDELAGREVARRLGFSVQGSLGILIESKRLRS